MADPNTNTKDQVDTQTAGPAETANQAAGQEIADEALIEEVSIDGMCGVY